VIDYWKLTKDFTPGDLVQKFMPGRSDVSPYVGRVTAVMQGIGFLDVQWPFGNERVSPEELLKVNPAFVRFLPPTLNPSYYPGLDTVPPKTAHTVEGVPLWRTAVELPVGFHKELAKVFHKGASAIQTYDILWHQYRQANDEALRDEVSKFYRVAHNLVTAFLGEQARVKDAAYWAAKDRKYRATQTELETKKLACPKCKTQNMRKITYKMTEGQRTKLFACSKCLHLVKQSDCLGPGGESVEW
jgi:hypothetical protein